VADPGSTIAAEKIAGIAVAVRAAEEKWQSAKPKSYSYRLISGGPFGYETYLIEIDGGQCHAQSRSTWGNRETPWKRDTCGGQTISAVFTELKRQLELPQELVEVTFDPVYGYPTKVRVQPVAEDQSEYFEVTEFNVLERAAPNKSLERKRER
jgi:hypothetical protein